jgi:hypothetical protein
MQMQAVIHTKFVIRRKEDNRFLKGGTSMSPLRWVDSIQDARVYGRRCDVSNSINEQFKFSSRYRYERKREFNQNYDVLDVVLVQLKTGI